MITNPTDCLHTSPGGIANDLRVTLSGLDSDQIRTKIHDNVSIDEPYAMALAVLAQRRSSEGEGEGSDTDVSAVAIEPMIDRRVRAFQFHSYLVRCLGGRERLRRVYWPSVLGLVLIYLPTRLVPLGANTAFALFTYQLLTVFPLQLFAAVSVWRCAFNCGSRITSLCARAWVVFGALVLAQTVAETGRVLVSTLKW